MIAPIFELSLEQLVADIKKGQISAKSVMNAVYQNIEKHNASLNVFRSLLDKSRALAWAESIDAKVKNGESLGRLAGIPVTIKDNICILDTELKTTCGSKILENFHAPYHATVVEKLIKEDALVIGKTNMDEFAMGSSTENSAYAATRNPWDLERVPGGSSGAAAVSIAARMALLALGSDTGGSIRQPASMCGVTGIKPTYGVVSRYGLVAYGSSLDQIGCFAKSAEDCALGLSVIQGYDERDSTSAQVNYEEGLSEIDLSQLKFCLPLEYIDEKVADAEVIASVKELVSLLKKSGATIEERSLPLTQHLVPTYYILAFAEASSNLGRFDGIRYGSRKQNGDTLESLYKTSRSSGFGTEVKRRIMLGTFVLSAGYYDQYYGKAGKVRKMIENEVESLFTEFDFIIGPVSPFPAFKLGEKTEDPLLMYLADIYSVLANLTRTPAISIPTKLSASGLPIGTQLIGRKFQDAYLLSTAVAIQKLTDYHKVRAPQFKG
ncbi:MAG: Asp-tRNA(Asn)/Glu-tRNA(Gln) amidotransferase subunit GatA [SAR324 cluster bacterium]|nr:Asp-tRNA(Asn)/Glu-tRNA(Gln) amidotransferase subunit GatA [SAR324 cluster bacterium]